MKIRLPTATYPSVTSGAIVYAKYGLAGIILCMVLAQLFAFESMPGIFAHQLGSIAAPFASVIAAVIIIIEVTSVLCLLTIALSPALRWVSRLCSVFMWPLWYGIVLMGITSNLDVNSGILGAKVAVPVHAALLMVIIFIGLCAVFVQYYDLRIERALRQDTKSAKIPR